MAEYANIPLPEVYEIDIFSFWALLRDVIIYNHSHSKEGRKWLKNAWRLTQTEPETEKLHKKAGKGGWIKNGSSKNH